MATQRDPSKSLSGSNTYTGSTEAKRDDGAEHTSSSEHPSLPAQSRTINVVLFGETGVGKSSVINLVARKEVAKVSSDVNGCTMQSTRYNISFDDMNFAIFDTIGLEEPQMGVNGYLKAIEKAYELIVELGAAGGIHLLLFCMRGGRITATTQSNYRLFCECLCSKKVPVALVFTGLEREVEMEDWWKRNETYIAHYGIKSDGHACITAVQDDTPGEDLKYTESQRKIRELLKTCALKSEAFSLETTSWLARVGSLMRSLIKKQRVPGKRNVMRVLTRRCKLDPETARKIVDMMERNDTKTEDGQPGNKKSEATTGPAGETDEKRDEEKNTAEDGCRDDGLDRSSKSAAGNEDLASDQKPADQQDDAKNEHLNGQPEADGGGRSMGSGNGGHQPQGSGEQMDSEETRETHDEARKKEGQGGSKPGVGDEDEGDWAYVDPTEGSVHGPDEDEYHTATQQDDTEDELSRSLPTTFHFYQNRQLDVYTAKEARRREGLTTSDQGKTGGGQPPGPDVAKQAGSERDDVKQKPAALPGLRHSGSRQVIGHDSQT